jgi:hypothetical protein
MPSSFQSTVAPYFLLGALFLCGCSRDEPAPRGTDPATVRELTAEEARAALLDMIEHNPGEFHFDWIPSQLKAAPIRRDDDGAVWIGHWECHLEKRQFNLDLHNPEAERHKHIWYRGVFQQSPQGKWTARLTNSGHTL